MNCTPKELIECLNKCKYIKGQSSRKVCWNCKACVGYIPCKDFYDFWEGETDRKRREKKCTY